MNITLKPAKIIVVAEPIQIECVRDLFSAQKIVAKIKGLPREVVLWNGTTEYAAAANWTNDTALARANEVLALNPIPFNN